MSASLYILAVDKVKKVTTCSCIFMQSPPRDQTADFCGRKTLVEEIIVSKTKKDQVSCMTMLLLTFSSMLTGLCSMNLSHQNRLGAFSLQKPLCSSYIRFKWRRSSLSLYTTREHLAHTNCTVLYVAMPLDSYPYYIKKISFGCTNTFVSHHPPCSPDRTICNVFFFLN